ncbi:hypothetical protein RHMOL_Rhmol05G0069600 [Rhododendron molle]|uniref:Uncharacterized protein n=1 Tax=Rhododendron molle TaxID=49168 RepID=A0ACC0NNK3_RHOML|nr:hypothetical protein RHMOL_Rhmol05G0069600 [Rhododendron molle]
MFRKDDQGRWSILGLYGKLACSSSLERFWAIYHGLTILLDKGMANVKIEPDSSQAVMLIKEGPTSNCPHRSISSKMQNCSDI